MDRFGAQLGAVDAQSGKRLRRSASLADLAATKPPSELGNAFTTTLLVVLSSSNLQPLLLFAIAMRQLWAAPSAERSAPIDPLLALLCLIRSSYELHHAGKPCS